MRGSAAGTTLTSTAATRPVAISARRRSSTSDLRNGSPLRKRAIWPAWPNPNGGAPADRDRAERRERPRPHRQHQRRRVGFVVDLDLLVADLGEREAFLAERDL